MTNIPVDPSIEQTAHPVVSSEPAAKHSWGKTLRSLLGVGFVLAVLVFFIAFIAGVPLPGLASTPHEEAAPAPPTPLGVHLVEGKSHTLQVPEDVRASLGIRKGGKDRIEVVEVPTATRPLTLFGSTDFDPTKVARIRARFPAQVVRIGQKVDFDKRTDTGETTTRELRTGDRVQKGDLLGIFFSVDVGSKKNDLLDALVQLKLDQHIYDHMANSSAIPEVMLLDKWRAVQQDRNAIDRALQNLKVWNIPQDEIDDLHAEADKLSADKKAWFRTPAGRWVKGEKQGMRGQVDLDKENDNPWGKVTMRAPFEGIIVERNVNKGETVVDNTVNLFQIANVKRMQVNAYAPEDELPTLNALTREQRKWSVRTVGANSVSGLAGPIAEIGYLIDPNQHTAMVKGYIDNPNEQIRSGQFVSCTIQIPPPKDVVEVPIDAVIEDGKYCVVFVQTDADKHYYTMRRVQLTHRFEKTAFVRSKPFAKREQLTAEEKELGMPPKEPLRPGDRILRSGVGELKAALLDLESRPAKDAKERKSK